MLRESSKDWRERRDERLKGYDEEAGRRRYRGFLPASLRSYAISLLRGEAGYDPRKHYERRYGRRHVKTQHTSRTTRRRPDIWVVVS